MYLRPKISILIFLIFFSANLLAVDFSGSYKMRSEHAQLYLYIQQSGNKISCGLTGTTGADFKLSGVVQGSHAFGKCYGDNVQVFFNLYFEGTDLYLQIIEPGSDGKPNWKKVRELVFKKSGGGSSHGAVSRGSNPLSKSTADFSGTFAGDGLNVSLTQSGNAVVGNMNFGAGRYSIKGRVDGVLLKGVFSTPEGEFSFNARLDGKKLVFETAGSIYNLKKQETGNPLAAKKKNPLANNRSGHSHANNAETRTPKEGRRISVKSLGLSFAVPPEWIAKKDPNSGNYFMGSNSIPGYILMIPHNYGSIDELVAASAEGFVDKSINMHASTDIEKITGNAIGAEFSGVFKNVQARAYVVGVLSPNGGGFIAMCITKSDKFTSAHKNSALALARSVRFFKREVNNSLLQWFAGEYYSYTGHTERRLVLCPNGIYSYSSESSYGGGFTDGGGNSTGSWGTAGQDGDKGRWGIIGDKQGGTLVFTSQDGGSEERSYVVRGKGLIYIDNIKFGYKGPANCR